MKHVHKRLTYANVMSSLAVFLVLGGATAFAATELGKNTVGTKQLKKEAVTLAKIKKATKNALKGATGPEGKQGPEGKEGPIGKTGPAGLTEYELVQASTGSNTTTPKTLNIACPAGKKVIGTGFDIDGGSTGGKKEASIDAVDINPGGTAANFEAYAQIGAGTPSFNLTGEVVCAKVE